MLVFCSNSMTAEEIHLCHLKIKNKNKEIKYSVTVDGFLETYSTVEQVYDVMQRLKFHYYFIDIENSKLQHILSLKTNTIIKLTLILNSIRNLF